MGLVIFETHSGPTAIAGVEVSDSSGRPDLPGHGPPSRGRWVDSFAARTDRLSSSGSLECRSLRAGVEPRARIIRTIAAGGRTFGSRSGARLRRQPSGRPRLHCRGGVLPMWRSFGVLPAK